MVRGINVLCFSLRRLLLGNLRLLFSGFFLVIYCNYQNFTSAKRDGYPDIGATTLGPLSVIMYRDVVLIIRDFSEYRPTRHLPFITT